MLILLLLGLVWQNRQKQKWKKPSCPVFIQVLLVDLCEGTFLMPVSVWVLDPLQTHNQLNCSWAYPSSTTLTNF